MMQELDQILKVLARLTGSQPDGVPVCQHPPRHSRILQSKNLKSGFQPACAHGLGLSKSEKGVNKSLS
jgi:hypothetical protein